MSRRRASVQADRLLRAGLDAPLEINAPDLANPILERVEIRRPFLTEIQQRRAARVRGVMQVAACVAVVGASVLGVSASAWVSRVMSGSTDRDHALARVSGLNGASDSADAAAALHASAAAMMEPVFAVAIGLPAAEATEAAPITGLAAGFASGRPGNVGPPADLAREAWAFTRAFIAPPAAPRPSAGGLTDQLESLLSGTEGGLTPR